MATRESDGSAVAYGFVVSLGGAGLSAGSFDAAAPTRLAATALCFIGRHGGRDAARFLDRATAAGDLASRRYMARCPHAHRGEHGLVVPASDRRLASDLRRRRHHAITATIAGVR